tara:strand:+ start:129 stop:527 length:399 start_codon:yes stop_codon:yes gene_type:complete
MKKSALKSDPILWGKIVAKIKLKSAYGTSAGQWSARKAQAAVKEYKKAGGNYLGGGKLNTSLNKWIIEEWRTKSGNKSSDTGERYLPTKAIESLSDKEYKITSDKKRKDSLEGQQFSKQPKSIAKKTKKYRI